MPACLNRPPAGTGPFAARDVHTRSMSKDNTCCSQDGELPAERICHFLNFLEANQQRAALKGIKKEHNDLPRTTTDNCLPGCDLATTTKQFTT